MTPTARPASGATSMAAAARITSAVSTLCTSSSRSVPASVTTTSAACPAKRAALSSSASQAASRGSQPGRADALGEDVGVQEVLLDELPESRRELVLALDDDRRVRYRQAQADGGRGR